MQSAEILKPGARVCLVGIGGISMSSLAFALARRGDVVWGSDRSQNAMTDRLEAAGIRVVHEHRGDTVESADAVIRTAAVHDDNPEVARARQRGIPVLERAQAWGDIMRGYRDVVCFAGCHGKSSTTGIATHIALEAALDPSVMIGAELPVIGGNYRIGEGELFLAEACEYCDSFLHFPPTVAVLNNIEEDHLDYFKNLENIKRSFRKFAELVPPDGTVAANRDSETVRDTLAGYGGRVLWFGLGEGCAVTARDIVTERGYPAFTLVLPSGERRVRLRIPGTYNVYNALAAAAAFTALGTDIDAIARGLAGYGGIARRFERCGEINGAPVVDDYAHHPTALHELLTAVRAMGYERVLCAFQPHTYSRTAALYEDFKAALALADVVLLADVYAAREDNVYGVDMARMAREIEGAEYLGSFEKIAARIRELARPGDIVLTVGAGDIWQVNRLLTGDGCKERKGQ